MHKKVTAAVVAAGLLIGTAGAALLIPDLAAAADPTASPAATTAPTNSNSNPSGSSTTQASPGNSTGTTDCPGGPRDGSAGVGMGSDDITAAAKALGMTEADLTAALQGGQTLAQVAAAQNVDAQALIDAMVAAEKAEIQADVDAGTITLAQADQRIANLTQHETDEVNGIAPNGGPGFPGGRHGQPPAGSSTDTSTSDSTAS